MQYNKVLEKNIEEIKGLINDNDRIFYGENINEDYRHDELGFVRKFPEIVVKVSTTEEVSNIMKYAYENNIPVTAREYGTRLVGACVLFNGGIIIDLSGMNNILELDEENLTLTVEPGVLLNGNRKVCSRA